MEKKEKQWLDIATRLQGIAQAGLEYCHNDFDRDRYKQILAIGAEIMESYSELSKEEILIIFNAQTGYPTPKVDVRAVVFNEGKILLVREKLDGKWSLPGGWADQHLTVSENVEKESKEEAGVEVKSQKILAILDRNTHNYPPIPFGCYKIFVLCELLGGKFQKNTETSDSGFFSQDALPELSTGRVTPEQIRLCYEKRDIPGLVEFD